MLLIMDPRNLSNRAANGNSGPTSPEVVGRDAHSDTRARVCGLREEVVATALTRLGAELLADPRCSGSKIVEAGERYRDPARPDSDLAAAAAGLVVQALKGANPAYQGTPQLPSGSLSATTEELLANPSTARALASLIAV